MFAKIFKSLHYCKIFFKLVCKLCVKEFSLAFHVRCSVMSLCLPGQSYILKRFKMDGAYYSRKVLWESVFGDTSNFQNITWVTMCKLMPSVNLQELPRKRPQFPCMMYSHIGLSYSIFFITEKKKATLNLLDLWNADNILELF